ncbi:Conserved oligomeric Golgi complex subunit 3 Short=COG complex subunit 3 [Rhizoctonia solani AG-1 IB]|uniref:Conserved oligomeric Golgi complex subunit 3 Short=COG complex subunit 3 n=1 Tax=Thanatephorus cucumeris (strain AG1-IB / isolate 7/3/14) TaxID=1108050 RepID=M5BKB5_THACB|nr:Conserved oligomeric Golgi complex subunit 3 Short=COG complex subunit 3 [Rhizoctonia solani AG-1 IB]
MFGCCLGRRDHSYQPDEHTALLPPPIEPIDSMPIIDDSTDLKEQLFAAHRDAASRMVNVEADHPFVVVPTHDSSYSHSESRSQSRSSSRHYEYDTRSMSPERHEREDSSDADVFHVQIQGVRFLRPEVMRGRTGSVSRGRPRLDLRNGNARGSKENMIPVPGEGLSSYDTQLPTPTQPIKNPLETPLALKGKSVLPSPHARPALTVEDWEAKAPLDDVEVRSVLSLKIRCEEKKPPLKFRDEDSPSRPSTPVLGRHGGLFSSAPGSRSATPVPMLTITKDGASHPLHPQVPLETPQQFHDWFALIDRSITYSQESHFRSHLQNVEAQLVSCDNLLDRVHGASDDLTLLHNDWQSVEDRGESLKGAAQRLLEERDRLIQVTDAIGARLEYFQELEYATRMLNHPGEALVLQTDFLLMVERVDVCLEYMKTHRHFKEAEIYLLRFQQCLTRAMTLIKMYLVVE